MTSMSVCRVSHVFVSVRCMMYGFGDDQNPYSESVDMLEDLVVEYITEMVIIQHALLFVYSRLHSVN